MTSTVTGTVEKKQLKDQVLKDTQGIYDPLRKRLYTLREASVYLGMTLWGVRSLVWNSKIPYVKDGKKILLDIVDMDAYIERMKVTYVG